MEHRSSLLIASREDLRNRLYLRCAIEYKKHKTSAIVFDFGGRLYAYINHCMHMQRPLDCQEDTVFDKSGELLRCSMHGFVFDPTSGECLSPVCAGQKLKALRVIEENGNVYFAEKRLTVLSG